MKKRALLLVTVMAACFAAAGLAVRAQEAAATGTAEQAGTLVGADGKPVVEKKRKANDFWVVVTGSGWFGVLIWVGLFGSAGGAIYFGVDSVITTRPKRIMPQTLTDSVTQAMNEGDVIKALERCENEPGPLANILTAGFSHVEEGFEVIQDAVGTAASLEVEKIMQKLNWISVMASLAPMLGLLGTVQGMIMAFAHIAEGAPDVGFLALAIAQALYTTAAGLFIAIPAIAMYYNLRNSVNKTVLRMEAMTMELIKDLRHVEVVEG
jgi:biopolymer transport protein ExbB